MLKNVIEPAGDFVLVIDVNRDTTLDGITLPDNMKQQEMIYGHVVEVGPLVTPVTKKNDLICYGPYAGKNIVLEGVEFRSLREGQIELYVRQKEVQ